MTLGDFRKITAGLEDDTPMFCEVDYFTETTYIICSDAVRIEPGEKGMSIVLCEKGDWGD